MVKKIKKLIVFTLFAFFYSLFSKQTEAAIGCVVPKGSNGKLLYQGIQTDKTIDQSWCY